MKTISQYREEIKNLMKAAADIDARCVNENRDMTEAEISLKNEILDTVEEHRKKVAVLERQERIAAALELPVNPPESRPQPTGVITSLPDSRSKDKFKSFGEQLVAARQAAMPGGHVDPRLHNINAAASGLGESVQSDGGFLVQQDFVNGLLQDTFATGVLASRCRRQPISGSSNSMKINGVDETSRVSTRYGGIVSYWADEAALATASKPKFRQITLDLKKMIGLCYATDELLADAAALEAFIRTSFPGEFGFQMDDAIFNGDGVGKPLGILQAGCLVTQAAETGQKAATILAENIIKMYSRRFAGQTSNYAWFYNQTIEPQLFTMSLAVGTGGVPIYMPPGGLSDAPYGRLMGLPAIAIEQAPALGTVGDIVLSNFQNGYILAEKGGIQSEVSIHVRFLYDESVFRFIMRIDGQPVRASALTPYKGGATATQSHFIALATRS